MSHTTTTAGSGPSSPSTSIVYCPSLASGWAVLIALQLCSQQPSLSLPSQFSSTGVSQASMSGRTSPSHAP
jgi:hypothetical protein